MYDAQAPHELRGEVPLLRRERGAPGERDSLGTVHDVAVRVLRDERVVAGRLDVLGELVEDEVPGLRFPCGSARRAVHRRGDAPRARCELHGGSALRAEAALIYRTVGVALDLKQLGLSVDFLCVCDERAAHGAIRAEGM